MVQHKESTFGRNLSHVTMALIENPSNLPLEIVVQHTEC